MFERKTTLRRSKLMKNQWKMYTNQKGGCEETLVDISFLLTFRAIDANINPKYCSAN